MAPSPVSPTDTANLFDGEFLRQLERLAILSRRAIAGQLQGERRSPKRGQSVEFSDFRPYAIGDDFRRIDWNAYARLERFFIKLFVEEEDLNVHILIDTSASMDWGEPNKLKYAIRAAAALGYIALAGLDRVTVTSLGGESLYFPPHRGKAQAHVLFTFLQGLEPTGSGAISKQMRTYRTKAAQPGPLLLISDLMDPQWEDGLRSLASGRYEVSVLHILSPDEINPDFTGDLKLLDTETQADVEITADFDLLARYRENLKDWQTELQNFCNARGMHYAPLATSLPLHELLFAWLRRQSVLR